MALALASHLLKATNMMVLMTCSQCGIRFYAPSTAQQDCCWRCERTDHGQTNEVAERLLAQVFPNGLPADV